MKAIVCGGRDYNDWETVKRVLDGAGITHIVEGGASGADTLARRWANNNLTIDQRTTIQAEWDKHGRGAGPIRNQKMLDECKPDLVIAFPGGRGTADMIRRAKRAGIPVQIV